jgi:hypothetical protein
MIAKTKKFDCVEMKHRIQRELINERRGLSRSEIHCRQEDAIEKNPMLKKFLHKQSSHC